MEYKIKVRVTSYKGKFRFTIPAKEIRRINATTNDYIKIKLKKEKYATYYYARIPTMPKSRTNLQVKRAVPKEFVEKTGIKKNDLINLQISLVKNKRSTKLIQNNVIDILAAVPEKTRSGRPIMVDLIYKNNEDFCRIWYCSGQGGNFKPIELKRFIKTDRQLGEFFGLMQAESRKGGSKFDFTNNLVSEHELFIKVAERFGISKSLWKYQIFVNPDMPEDKIKEQVFIFKEKLHIQENIRFIKSKTLCKVALAIYINSTILAEIMITIMLSLRSKITSLIDSEALRDFAIGFICKDLLGDGTVTNKKGKNSIVIVISEKDPQAQKEISQVLNNFRIKTNIIKNKIYLQTNLNTYPWFMEYKAFEGHLNRKKFLNSILKNYYIRSLYNRLHKDIFYTSRNLAKNCNLKISTAYMFLLRNKKRGFLDGTNGFFKLSDKGVRFIKVLNKAKEELTNLL